VENCQCEIWKQIPKGGGIYFVSSKGRIWVRQYSRPLPNGKIKCYKARFISNNPRKDYPWIHIRNPKTGERIIAMIHILVAEAFLGPRPTDNHVVNHKDGNKKNANLDNLEWITRRKDRLHAWATGLRKGIPDISDGTKAMPLIRWAEKLNIHPQTLYSRYYSGNTTKAILNSKEARALGNLRISRTKMNNSKRYKDDLTAYEWASKLGISRPGFLWRIKHLSNEDEIYKKGSHSCSSKAKLSRKS